MRGEVRFYAVRMPGAKKPIHLAPSQIRELNAETTRVLLHITVGEAAEMAYMETLFQCGLSRKEARHISIFKRGIHYMTFDRWARTKHWNRGKK